MNISSLRFAVYCFFFLIILQNKALSQEVRESVPVNERDICFFYTEASLPGESNYKVVIFSSYLYRAPMRFGYNSPSGILGSAQFRTVLTNSFYKKCEKIMSDETTGYAYSSIQLDHPKEQWGYFDNTSAKGPYELYNVISSTTSYLEQVREKVIADFRRRGYTILQTNFSNYFDESLIKAEVEQVSKLSSLIIPDYTTGLLNEYAKRFRNNSSSGGGSGLTVTSKEEKKNESGSNSGATKKAEDPDKWKRQVEMDRVRSMDLEAEGDRLEKMGSAFAQSAYAKYKEAYTLYPSERVKQKMDTIAAYAVLAQGITKLGEGIGNTIEALDPKKKTRHLLVEFRYAGLAASYKNILNQNNQSPSLTSVGILGHRTLISFGIRFGYMVSPTVEYRVKNLRTGNTISPTMRVQQNGGTVGMSGGLNIPLRNFVISGLYSYDIGFTLSEKILSSNFDYDSDASFKYASSSPIMSTYSLGFNYVLPKSGIGLGLYYNTSSYSGDDGGGLITYKPNTSDSHGLNGTTQEKYKFSNLSFSFFIYPKGSKKK